MEQSQKQLQYAVGTAQLREKRGPEKAVRIESRTVEYVEFAVKVASLPGKSPRGNVVAKVCPDGMLGIFTPLNVAEGNA